ncbi:hybrid sensor histidine kinase/response regulator [Puniceibacterium sediminis]|uniref:hybrid sensor histidine kinase/response regulator n=1 Tax=Puniceibacterium sediminis TaxID=1608407 RepID=UPI001595008E|nr:PAS domain-containing sensor histidine kinase [Puniceibacterium sediminis]
MPIDANAGPLIFAGYLGGPIGALIAGACAAFMVSFNSGPVPIVGVFMGLAIPTVGLIIGYLRPPTDWPVIPRFAIGYLLCGFAALFLVPIVIVGPTIPTGNGYRIAAMSALVFIAVGATSILITWQILIYAAKFASEAARSAELSRRLDLSLQHSGMGMFERNVDDTDVYFDAGMMAAYGLDREPGLVPMSTWATLIHPDDLPRLQAEFQKSDTGERERDRVDFRVVRPDGTLRYARAYWVGEGGTDGKPTRVFGVQSDLTDIREAEQRQLETINRLAVIAENLPGVMFQSDMTDRKNPKLLYISPKCQDIWGYTDAEIYADSDALMRAHDPSDIDLFNALVANGIDSRTPVSHRYRITARDGTIRWLDYHGASTIKDCCVLIESIVLDVTHEVDVMAQVEKEREISYRAQKSESIGLLTGGVAHDFNNLLAVILGNLELLADENDPATQNVLRNAAITAALRGADLTKNLLSFARKARLTPEVLDLNNVLRDAKTWMGRTLPESISIRTSLVPELWPVAVDRSSLESALLNLILNARDAMAGQGNLTIETANLRIDQGYVDSRQEALAPGRYVMLAVSDTGEGIAQDDRASIFEPFFTTKPPGSGSGLGLSMILGFMKQSGGTVQVYTEVGEGTTFKLFFPAAEGSKEESVSPTFAEGEIAGRGQRVLVAEDEDAVRKTLVTILERAGYVVTATSSGDKAFAVFNADPTFDLLLTDIVMPGKLQGTHLAKALRQIRSDLPVVFMSGYATEAMVHGNGLRPEDIRLMKPVQRLDILAAVATVLQLRAN